MHTSVLSIIYIMHLRPRIARPTPTSTAPLSSPPNLCNIFVLHQCHVPQGCLRLRPIYLLDDLANAFFVISFYRITLD